MPRLTRSQESILKFVVRYRREHNGASPTVREIAREVGFRSPHGVACHLPGMVKAGVIEIDGSGARNIRVVHDEAYMHGIMRKVQKKLGRDGMRDDDILAVLSALDGLGMLV